LRLYDQMKPPVVLVKYAARYKGGEVRIEERAFNDYKWVNSQEVKQYECIIGIDKEVEATIALFKEA